MSIGLSRVMAHEVFDSLWMSGKFTRSESYEWLSGKIGIPKEMCHIKQFDEEQCNEVRRLCAPHLITIWEE